MKLLSFLFLGLVTTFQAFAQVPLSPSIDQLIVKKVDNGQMVTYSLCANEDCLYLSEEKSFQRTNVSINGSITEVTSFREALDNGFFEDYEEHKLNLVAVRKAEEKVAFHICTLQGECLTLGKPEGYTLDYLSFSPNLTKLGAVALGVAEAVPAIVVALGGGVILAAGFEGTILTFGAPIALWVGEYFVIDTLFNFFNKLNPAYHWRRGNVERDLQKLTSEEASLIEFDMEDIIETFDHLDEIIDEATVESPAPGLA